MTALSRKSSDATGASRALPTGRVARHRALSPEPAALEDPRSSRPRTPAIGRCSLWTILAAALASFVLTGEIVADTTWVSGAVSGEWTIDGNPYIVVDSTWVPEGDTLYLRTAVRVRFAEDQGLYVRGILLATGSNDLADGEIILDGLDPDSTRWNGLSFYGRQHSTLTYLELYAPDHAIRLDVGYRLTLNDCHIQSGKGIDGLSDFHRTGWDLNFRDTYYRSKIYMICSNTRITAMNSEFRFDLNPFDLGEGLTGILGRDGMNYSFTRCRISGSISLYRGTSRFDGCEIFRSAAGIPNHIIATEYIRNSYVQGGVGAANEIFNCIIEGDLSAGEQSDNEVWNCDVAGAITCRWANSLYVHNTYAGSGLSISDVRSVTIDSCIIDDNSPFGGGIGIGAWDDHIDATVSRSVVFGGVISYGDASVLFDHNTIIADSTDRWAIEGFSHERDSVHWAEFRNNVFLGQGAGVDLLWQRFDFMGFPEFQYNCVWGLGMLCNPGRHDSLYFEPDSTNLIADPEFEWFHDYPTLRHDSPCIDRGDPRFAVDADGTRSDIGAGAYFQVNARVVPAQQPLVPRQASFSVFPNPFNSDFSIRISNQDISPLTISIVDNSGRRVYESKLDVGPKRYRTVKLLTPALPSGSYTLLVRSMNRIEAIPVNCLR